MLCVSRSDYRILGKRHDAIGIDLAKKHIIMTVHLKIVVDHSLQKKLAELSLCHSIVYTNFTSFLEWIEFLKPFDHISMPRCQIDLILIEFLLFGSLSASRFTLCLLSLEKPMT